MASRMTSNRPPRPASRNDFHIAILCALPLEADAVEAVFDFYWDDGDLSFDKTPGDPNAYSTGVIGRHNVVLAHMPGMGVANAASVASACKTSFPNIRLGLVVGICGIVPDDDGNERVLGDIIISDGVVQYDFGRQMDGCFERKNTLQESLGRPPSEVRSVLAKLSGIRGLAQLRKRTASHLSDLQATPELRATYPGKAYDKLFEPDYRHVDNGRTCDELGCNGTLVPRKRLLPELDEPTPGVHFGLIASGSTVMKSGMERDRIARKENVVAFEMEGAGAWESFPCVVIKGACDYADSHKNKVWQRYAAAAAAACMKGFLQEWVPAETVTQIPKDPWCDHDYRNARESYTESHNNNEWQGYAAMVAAAYAKEMFLQVAPNKVESQQRIANPPDDLRADLGQLQLTARETHDEESYSEPFVGIQQGVKNGKPRTKTKNKDGDTPVSLATDPSSGFVLPFTSRQENTAPGERHQKFKISYKVTIKNESGDIRSSRVYIIYSDTPKVSGGGDANARPLQWAKTRAIGNGGQDVFKYTSESFGFVGYSSIRPSSNMSAGTEITLDSSVPAIVGSLRNDGSQFYVKENDGSGISINDTGSGGASKGTLTISCDAGIPSPSTYVVGLARKSERDGIAPVAAVECKPGVDLTITPSPAIFIARGDQGDGTVLSNKTPNQRVEFRGNSREATVSDTSSGSFSVVYK